MDDYYPFRAQLANHQGHSYPANKAERRKPSQRTTRRNKVKTARMNQASTARILDGELVRPYVQGQLRYVARGVYTSGARKGQMCAIKWPKSSHSLTTDPFKYDIEAARATFAIVDQWNARRIIDQPIRVNIPVVWRLGADMGYLAGTRVIVEPFIVQFRKWNSNTGWSEELSQWGRVMQALSHFSYQISNGHTLVCDLKGGFSNDHAVVTDPVVFSISRSYGSTDMGAEGISNFFAGHKCNEYCRRSWKKPKQATKYFSAVRSTYMLPI